MREAENRQNMSRKGITVGVDTGIHDLNVITGGGWKPGQLIVIGEKLPCYFTSRNKRR